MKRSEDNVVLMRSKKFALVWGTKRNVQRYVTR